MCLVDISIDTETNEKKNILSTQLIDNIDIKSSVKLSSST